MLNEFRRRFAAILMQILAVVLGLISAAVLLTGFFITAVVAVTVALMILIYLALSRRRRRWQYWTSWRG